MLVVVDHYSDGEGETTHALMDLTRFHTGDDMLRTLRRYGLVMSERRPGTGNVLWWRTTEPGELEAANAATVAQRLKAVQRLEASLGETGYAYARRYARWQLGLRDRPPERPHYARSAIWAHIEGLVRSVLDEALDAATAGR